MTTKTQQKGFTILVAVVTASILLIVAMSIAGIALKEQVLSTANKDSEIAFYTADSGMECALYWDLHGVFTAQKSDLSYGKAINMNCNNSAVTDVNGDAYAQTSQNPATCQPGFDGIPLCLFEFRVALANGTCALISVTKSLDPSDPNHHVVTHIYSRGYNTCNASLNRLERGIWAKY